ncbi:MAG: MFS transporter [Rhodospirillales bacterium]|jgi:predicted MFS family arabinose efflux permease|nr:MFS transporter [Rhodospirillales bacterium]
MGSLLTRLSVIFGVFSNHAFAVFTAGNSVSLVGLWVQRLAVGWLAWHLTQSGFWLGAVAFADLFPVVFVGPFAGVFADRQNQQRIIIVCRALSALQAVVLTVLVYFDAATIEAVFALTLFGGTVTGIQQPARLAIVSSLVRPEHLGSAVAINSVVFNLARFVGPAIAGVLITSAGTFVAFALAALGHIFAAVTFWRVRLAVQESAPRRGMLTDLADGARYAVSHAAIGPMLILAIIGAVLARPVFELLPGFADAVFDRGAGGLAILTSAVGVGAIVAGLWLAQRRETTGLTAITLGSFAVTGVLVAAFALTGWFWLGASLMAAAGGAMVVNGTGTQTLIQTAVARQMRGRVLGIWGITFRGGPAIGAVAMGWLAEYWGFGAPVALGGVLCAGAAAVMYPRRGRLAQLLETGSAPAGGGSSASNDLPRTAE